MRHVLQVNVQNGLRPDAVRPWGNPVWKLVKYWFVCIGSQKDYCGHVMLAKRYVNDASDKQPHHYRKGTEKIWS